MLATKLDVVVWGNLLSVVEGYPAQWMVYVRINYVESYERAHAKISKELEELDADH